MKKLNKILLLSLLSLTSVSGLVSCDGANSDVKIGVILVGDESEGYTLAHMNGIEDARKALGLREDQIIYKKKVEENNNCYVAAKELAEDGCSLIISNSYSHQDYVHQAAVEYPDITFVAATGDYAAISGSSNLKNAFTKVYESRYVSGVVAGLKIKELADANKLTAKNYDSDNNVKVGYVGAYPYAEVVSGYTAFYLGIKSVYEHVSMEVQYTNSWFNISDEAKTAGALIDDGCVIIGQHADSTGAPSECEKKLKAGTVCYSVGYNVDMLGAAPTAALTSATNNWGVYYTYAFRQLIKGEEIATDWAEGYATNTVGITTLGSSCATGTKDKVDETVAKIKNGSLKVFDVSKFTVNGQAVTSNIVDLSYYDYSGSTPRLVYQGEKVETVKNGAIEESVVRSAPYFSLRIDGITELTSK